MEAHPYTGNLPYHCQIQLHIFSSEGYPAPSPQENVSAVNKPPETFDITVGQSRSPLSPYEKTKINSGVQKLYLTPQPTRLILNAVLGFPSPLIIWFHSYKHKLKRSSKKKISGHVILSVDNVIGSGPRIDSVYRLKKPAQIQKNKDSYYYKKELWHYLKSFSAYSSFLGSEDLWR